MNQTFDPPSDQARQRKAPRDAMFLHAELRREGAAVPLTLRVRNLAAGGLMVETQEVFTRDEALTVTLRNVGEVPGRVAWVKPGRVGIAFDHPIDPREARKPALKSPGSAMMLVKGVPARSRRPGLTIG